MPCLFSASKVENVPSAQSPIFLSGELDELRALFGCHGNRMILVRSVMSGAQLKEDVTWESMH